MSYYLYLLLPILLFLFYGIKIVRPTHKGLIERLGKYQKLAQPGFHWIIPVIDRMFLVNIKGLAEFQNGLSRTIIDGRAYLHSSSRNAQT